MCNNRSRTTVLLGAGGVLELASKDGFKPTTANITKEILDNKPLGYDPNTRSQIPIDLINRIYEYACQSYHPQPISPLLPDSYSKIHFEIIFFLLESLETYERSWKNTTHPKHTNQFASFVGKIFQCNDIELLACYRHIIDIIIKSVRKYNDVFDSEINSWYKDFWGIKPNGWDIFNLNYDTTIEDSLSLYEDGFEPIKDQDGFLRFSVEKLLSNKKHLSTINHMHGCILYGNDRYKDINHDAYDFQHQDMYKWPNPDAAYSVFQGVSSSHDTSQDGSSIIQGPIITGLNKTDKVICLPYDAYRHNFFKCIVNNNSLIIAGYSFGDYYINNMFYRMFQVHGSKTRVVLIDYFGLDNYIRQSEELYSPRTDSDLRPRFFDHFFEVGPGIEKEEMLLFIKRIAHYDYDVWEHFKSLSLSGPMISDNGMLMLFIGGFKAAIDGYSKQIVEFLIS